ncbi:unnamed protein product [Nezara viridula]|uniref:Uncharacterized protein n=1 Tax=Nezara viridula TaxID=85310 RepID=A0A9P0HTU7_NEZVI|nr:unnamed protein product [Nezara viridula]
MEQFYRGDERHDSIFEKIGEGGRGAARRRTNHIKYLPNYCRRERGIHKQLAKYGNRHPHLPSSMEYTSVFSSYLIWCSQLLEQREEEARMEVARLSAEIRALKLKLLQITAEHNESEFEALRALRKNWECPKCEKARKNIQPTDKCLSPPRSAPQQQTVDSTSQLLLAAIKNLTEEVKGLKFSLDANANECDECMFVGGVLCLGTRRFARPQQLHPSAAPAGRY